MHSAPLAAFVALAALGLQGCSRRGGGVSLVASSFGKYFNYNGDLEVQGTVTIKFATEASTSQDVEGELTGIDLDCNGTQTGAGNRCGVHVHSGESCAEDALGHFFSVSADPWVPVTYTNPDGDAVEFQHFGIDTGATMNEHLNKVVVVHDSTGARIACSKLASGQDDGQVVAASEDSGNMPWVLLAAMMVVATLGGWTYYYRSHRLSYGAQQDEAVEVQDAAPAQDESMQNQA